MRHQSSDPTPSSAAEEGRAFYQHRLAVAGLCMFLLGLVKQITGVEAGTGLTGRNTITGTPLYLSPEAIKQPDAVDAASDLYALGAVGWFLLVGRPPFEGQSILEVCGKHLHSAPLRPSQALGRPVPADLEDILLSCLEKQRERRPPGARVLRQRLNASSAAGSWTEELAARWWQEQGLQQRPPAEQPGSRPIALDVVSRAS